MTIALPDAIAGLVDSHRRGARLALLFDYDGTLVPIAQRPEMAVLGPPDRQRLERLVCVPAVSVGVLSGRSLDNLKATVGISGLYYAGTSGLELDLCGVSIAHPESVRAARLITTVVDRLRDGLLAFPGVWVEQKPLGVSVHYREVPEDRAAELRRWVLHAIDSFSGVLQVLDGPMAIEVIPNLGWTKSSALFKIMEHIGGEVVIPLCAGDEANDADLLRAADALGGVALGIGARAPATARYRLPNPQSLGFYLDTLADMLELASCATHDSV